MSTPSIEPTQPGAQWPRLSSGALGDAILAGVVAIVAYVVAVRAMAGFNATPWMEDLLLPCTGMPGWVPDPAAVKLLPQWQAFIERRIPFFPCDAIAGMPLLEVGISWERLAYFHHALGAWYRVFGPSLNGFITFQAFQYAVANAAAYLLFRVGLWRSVALACAAGLVWSKWQLGALHLPVEYAKVPWIFATAWLCGLMVIRDTHAKPIWLPALAAGLVAGVGIGFKTDVIAMVPLAVATALFFVRRGTQGQYRRSIATLCVVVGVAVGGGQMLYRNFFSTSGSVLAVQFLGGQDSITEAMHAVTPLYDYGLVFDDSHITALLNSYGRRVHGTTAPVYFYSREMQVISTDLLRTLWTTFPGDLLLRVFAATPRVLELGPLALPAAILGLALLFVKDLRAGWFVAFVAIYLSSYVSMVFQRRHFFQLEFISWWLAGFLAQALWFVLAAVRRRAWADVVGVDVRRRVVVAALCLGLLVTAASALLAAARGYQNAGVLRLLEAYQAAPIDERATTVVPGESGGTLIRVAGMSVDERDSEWRADRMEGHYLLVGLECRTADPISVTAKYRPPGADWDRTFVVPCTPGPGPATLMVPIYQYGSRHRFEGLWLDANEAQSVRQVATMRPTAVVNAWPSLHIPPDWRSQKWYKTLKSPLETP